MSAELNEAGFQFKDLLAVTSFASMIPDVKERLSNQAYRNVLLETIRMVEKEPSLMGIGNHFVGIGKKEK